MTETAMWTIIAIQAGILLSILAALIKINSLLVVIVDAVKAVNQKLNEDSHEHAVIVEKLSALDEDIRDLRRDRQ